MGEANQFVLMDANRLTLAIVVTGLARNGITKSRYKDYSREFYKLPPFWTSPHADSEMSARRANLDILLPIGSRYDEKFASPITPHPQHDQQNARQAPEHRPRDTQLAESHSLAVLLVR